MVRISIACIEEGQASTITLDFDGDIRRHPIQHFRKDIKEFVKLALIKARKEVPDADMSILSVFHGEESLSLAYLDICEN